MKNLFILFGVFAFSFASAQTCSTCSVSGWQLTIPTGSYIQYTATTVPNGVYHWVATGGLSIVTGQGTTSVVVIGTTSGSLFVSIYADGVSACVATAAINVLQPPAAPASIATTLSPCLALTATAAAVPGASFYRWTIDGAYYTTSNSASIVISFPPSNPTYGIGTKNLCVAAMNQFGVVGPATCTNYTGCPDAAAPAFSVSMPSCAIVNASITSSLGAVSFRWYWNGRLQTSQTGTTFAINSREDGNISMGYKTLCVEGINAYGVAGPQTCKTFSVCPPPAPAVTMNANGCTSATLTITNVTNAVTYNVYYQNALLSSLSPASGATTVKTYSFADYPQLVFTNKGNGVCVETVDIYGVTSTTKNCWSGILNICPSTAPGISLSMNACVSVTITFTNTPNAKTYNIYSQGSFVTSTPVSPGATTVRNFSYADYPLLRTQGKANSICAETIDIYGTVSPTRNCATLINCQTVQVAREQPEDTQVLQVFPNPSSHELSVRFDGEQSALQQSEYTIKIFDLKGAEVKSATGKGMEERIYVGDLPKSTYIIKILRDGKVSTKHVLIE